MRRVAPLLSFAALLAGCNPHNAETEGKFTAFLSVSTSATIFQDALNLDDFESHTQVDCRDPDDVNILGDADTTLCPAIDDFDHERWLGFDGYEVVSSPLEPWRGEAVMTAEGDLLITFHNRLPGGEDFRFAIAVDPRFQPTHCGLIDGQSTVQAVDGDWLAEWSRDVSAEAGGPGGTLFYLNAFAYQFNPSNVEQYWILPDKWLAGAGIAKFAQEDFYIRAVRYGRPSAYTAFELEEGPPDSGDLFYSWMRAGDDPKTNTSHQAMLSEIRGIAAETTAEWAMVGADVTPMVHANDWRAPDGSSPGLDGWGELHYNWIRFDQPATDLVAGAPATGAFSLVMDAGESQSRLLIDGTFNIDLIKKDRWTVGDLSALKTAEYAADQCGAQATAE